jgi:hypothetical protein
MSDAKPTLLVIGAGIAGVSAALEAVRTNDEALLRFAFRWLRFAMFAEPTMKVREGAVDRSTT